MKFERDGFSVESAIAKGRELPAWYLDEPLIDNPDAFYLKAFGELTTERPGSFSGFMPIPHSSIIDYAQRAGLDRAMSDGLVLIIRKMDAAYTKWHDEIAEKQSRQKSGGIGNRTRAK